MAILGFLGAASAIVDTVGDAADAIGGGNPKDAERAARIDSAFQSALAGDGRALVLLKCMAGETTPEAVAWGFTDQNGQCGLATEWARSRARTRLGELAARRAIGGAAGAVTTGAIAVGEAVQPGSTAGPVFHLLRQRVFGSLTLGTVLLGLGVGFLAFRLLRAGGRG